MPQQETQPNAPQQGVASDRDTHLPHDRDEKAGEKPGTEAGNPQHDQNRKSIRQAHSDTESDIQDTERIGTPNDVPSASDNR